MTTIYDIKKRAQQLSEKTDSETISPQEVGGLFSDLADYANDVDVNGSSLGIRKTYTSVSAMEADKNPVGDDGKPLKKGQLVNIYNQDDPSSADNNKVFSWQNPGWQIRTTLDAGYATREELTELEGKLETNFIVTDIPLDKVVISNFIPNAVIQEDRVIISEDFSNFKVLTIDNQTASNKYLYANFETIGSPYNYFRNILIEKGEEKYISTTLVGWNCVVVPAGYKVTIGLKSANNDVYQVNTFYKNKEEYENGFLKQNIGLYKKDYYIYNTPRVKKEVTNYQENTVIQDGKIVTDSGFSNFKVYEAVATNSSIYINANFEPINQNNYDYFSNFMLLDADDNIVYLTSITGANCC